MLSENSIKHIILIISLIALAIFYGCGSHSSNPVSVSAPSEIVLSSREVVIDEKGRLPTITFPNGVKIEASEENTLTPGITVIVTELEKATRDIDYFTNSYHSYIYRIVAYQNSSDLIDSKTYVTTLENPFKITISKDLNSQGIVLAGINENESEPWRFYNLSGPSANIINLARLSEAGPKEYTFELYRLGIQFALITYDGNASSKIPDTFISSINASSSAYIIVKDGKYTEDLTLKCILNGQNLAYMKPSDFRAKVTYRNNLSKSSSINVNGIKVSQITTADKTVPGYIYAHSFLVDSLSDSNLMSSVGEFTFILNLKNVEAQSFPSGFLIEFFNKVDPEKIIPYKYTEFFTIKKAESINITLSSSDANLADKDKNLYVLNPTFKITSNYDFDKSEKEKIAKAVSVSNIDSAKVSKAWKDKTLTLSFKENLQQNTSYTISIGDVNNKEGFIITTFNNFIFTTKPELYNIEYNYNGGNASPNPAAYDVTTAEFTLNNPTKEGYDFIGWSGTGLKGKNNLVVTIKPGSKGNRSYTANYTPTSYSITYYLNGGTITLPNPDTYDITSATIQLNNPSRPYYKFIGWTSEDINTPRAIVTIEQGSTGDKSFTANWIENPTNTYSVTLTKGIGIDEVMGSGLYASDSTVNATCTMLTGYEFAFWTGNITESTFTMPYYDVVMQANAQLINYSITYKLNGGKVETNNPTSYNINSDNLPLINPTRLGYTFLGWTGTDLDTASKTFFIPHGSTGNREYTANWSLDSYSITCNIGEGNVVTPNPTSYDVASANITLTNPVPTKDYYLFKGWSGTDLEGSENLVVTIPKGSVGNRVYTANYAPEVFPITYTYEGEMAENPDSYDTTTLSFILNNPTKEGYDFLGWTGTNIPAGTASLTVIIPKGSNGARSYTASFTQRFSIAYTLNGGTLAAANPDSYTKYSDPITLNNPSKDGCDFLGWTGSNIPAGTASLTVIIPKGSTGNRTYTASFTQIFTIAYTLSGGTLAAPNPVSYDSNSDAIALNNPTRSGYDFLGWEGTNIPAGTASLTVIIPKGSEGNRTYTASFTQRFTIGYTLNGGTLAAANPSSYNKYTDAIALNNPAKEGYDFLGWTGANIPAGTASLSVIIPKGSTGNKTYTASFTQRFTISYDLQGGTLAVDNPTTYNKYSNAITLNNPTKVDLGFLGWEGTGITPGTASFTVIIPKGSEGNRTYTASYTHSFTISYDLKGGSLAAPNPTFYDPNTDAIALNNPTKSGYDFLGWEGTDITPGTASLTVIIPKGSNGNRSYTASFTQRFTIAYTLNSGTLAAANPASYNKFTDAIALNNPTRSGYDFLGWTGTDIPAGTASLTVIIPKGSEGNKSYTASFTQRFSIAYTLNGGTLSAANPDSYNKYSNNIQLNNPTKAGFDFLGWEGTGITPGTASLTVIIPKGSEGIRSYTASYTQKFTIEYTLNEGIVSPANPSSYNDNSESITLYNPVRAGYDFLGWEGTGITPGTASMTVTIPSGSTGNRSYTASFTQRFSIAYTLNDGTVIPPNPVSYNTYTGDITLNNPVKASYDFLGWEGTGITPGTASLAVVIPRGSTGNRSYTASFTQRFSIAYTLNNGIVTAPNPDSYNEYTNNIKLNNPTKDGYFFLGWTGTNITPGTASRTVIIYKGSTGNREYVASFTEKYTIDYELNGGTLAVTNPGFYSKYTNNILLNNPTKSSHDFLGWTGTGIPSGTASNTVIIYKGSTGNREYVASFTPRYSIAYNLVNGTVAASNPTSYNKYTPTTALNNPTKSGYDFIGWEGTGITPGTASMAVIIPKGSEGDRTYTASFTQRFSIAYTLNGGSVAAANPVSYNKYSANIMLNNPTRADYDFLGWTGTNIPEGTASKSVVIYTGSEGNRQYVASFTEKYTITYNLSGGTSSNPLSYNKYTNSFTLTTPTRTGDTSSDFYVFIGWTGTDIDSVTKTVTIPQGSTGNRVFTAHWLEGKSFELSPGITLKMIKCPAGTFIMGSPEGELDRSVNESQHQVTLTQDYYIGIYEVTQIQYFTAMNTNPSNFKDGLATEAPTTSANHPVETVKWSDAKNFCAWLNTNITSGVPADYHFDLPTEAQWEYACRANTTTSLNNGTNIAYSTGFDPNLIEVAWCKTNSATSTQPVGGKKPNNWGLYDMHGNVNEWCLDLRDSDWTIDYLPDPVTDPYYTTGTEYIIRGGCFNNGENKRYRSAARDGKTTTSKFSNVGFRVVLTHD